MGTKRIIDNPMAPRPTLHEILQRPPLPLPPIAEGSQSMASARRRVPNTGEIGLERLLRTAQERLRVEPEPRVSWWRRRRSDADFWATVAIIGGVAFASSTWIAMVAVLVFLLRG